jgi:hypothetical protein
VKAIRLILIIAAHCVFMAVPSLATATNTYNASVACGYRVTQPAATTCPKKGRIGAFFQSVDAAVQYKTCVKFPNGQRQCTSKASAEQGTTYVVKITAGTRGTMKVTWRVGGVVVAKYSIEVT